MAIVSLPDFGADPVSITGPGLDAKVNPLATDYNGNIDNNNIVAGANIANSKLNLASISQAVTMTGGLTVSTTALTMTSMPINEAKGADIASATTPNITSATGNFVHITGTTTITGFATGTAGIRRILVFDGILTFTHNATSLILPTAANITTAAGDTAVMISEGSGNWRCTNFQRKDGTALSGTYTPTAANALSGSVIQTVATTYTGVGTGTTAIPFDDTIPQITEGVEYMTQAITPNNASNTLIITANAMLTGSNQADNSSVALFQDATANALAAKGWSSASSGRPSSVTLVHKMAAGTTSATTFRIRAGGSDTQTITFNGTAGGRIYGGIVISSIVIQEIKA